jgi:HD superfamily phosphodiesterase
MNIESNIKLAGQKFIHALEEFFKSVYDDNKLPSHGIDHHRRVWRYARELLHFINLEEEITDSRFIEKLIIACYLHDIGMAVDKGDSHGRNSRLLCEKFFRENNMSLPDYQDVLEAVENHDNKEYFDSSSPNKLLLLLSVADDLDAFGHIGIYRYIEIYQARGIQPDKIGPMILENAARRFKNFESIFGRFPGLIEKHRKRYLVLESFFKEFVSELKNSDAVPRSGSTIV